MSYIQITDGQLDGQQFIVYEVPSTLDGITRVYKITRIPQMFPNFVAKYIRDNGSDGYFTFTDETLS